MSVGQRSRHNGGIEPLAPPTGTRPDPSVTDLRDPGASAEPLGTAAVSLFEPVRDEAGTIVDFRCVAINERGAEALGLTVEQIEGRLSAEVPELRFSDEMVQRSLDVAVTGADATFLDTIDLPGHGRRRYRTTLAPLDGMVLVVAHDVTDEWTDSERLARLVDRAPTMMVVVAPDGAVRWASGGSRQVLGKDPGELIGAPQTEMIHPADAPYLLDGVAALGSASSGRRPAIDGLEYRIRNSEGQFRWIHFTIEDLTGVDPVDGIVCFGQDVTERHMATEFAALDAEIHGAIVAGTPFDLVLQSLCDRLVDILDATVVWVGLAEDDGSVSVRGSSGPIGELFRGVTPRWDDSPVGRGPIGECIRSRRTVVMQPDDPALHALDDHVRAALGRLGIRGGAAIPLIADSTVVGALGVNVGDMRTLDDSTISTLEGIASWIAVAISMNRGRQRERLLAAALAAAANAVAITDARGRITWVNDAYSSTTGFSFAEAVGHIPAPLDDPLGRSPQSREMWSAIASNRSWSGEITGRRRDGELYRVIKTVTPLISASEEIEHFVIIQEDVSALRDTEQRLERATTRDLLTGLPNRLAFLDQLGTTLQQRTDSQAWTVVACLDLDDFRQINERDGMDAGDRVLVRMAERLTGLVRSEDQLARLGADTFAIAIAGLANREQAVRRLEQLRARIQRSNAELRGEQITSGVVVVAPDGAAVSATDVLRDAELAMRQAKSEGRGAFAFFDEAIRTEVQDRLRLALDLREAIERGDLFVLYQPQFRLADGELVGVEALVRWQHPERGLMSPGVFLPIAEEAGLIPALDRQVREVVLAQLAAWLRDHPADAVPVVSVNLSPLEFADPDIAVELGTALERFGCPPEKVSVEILETAIVSDEAATVVEALSRLGVHLAIDDFGTGYSSLAYLAALPVDHLKIDRSFVVRLDEGDERAHAVVAATVALGHQLGLQITAEGVETESQESQLVAMGCDMVQGFLRSRPVPAETIDALIAERSRRP